MQKLRPKKNGRNNFFWKNDNTVKNISKNFLFYLHRLKNMELDLQSLFMLHVHSCTNWPETLPATPPPPPHLGSYTRAILVSQDRRHFFVTTWFFVISADTQLSVHVIEFFSLVDFMLAVRRVYYRTCEKMIRFEDEIF
jgi:hypothetical protein